MDCQLISEYFREWQDTVQVQVWSIFGFLHMRLITDKLTVISFVDLELDQCSTPLLLKMWHMASSKSLLEMHYLSLILRSTESEFAF